jgi:hypothetical protein
VQEASSPSKLKVENEGSVVIFRKKLTKNDVDGINGIDFATQWHIGDKHCNGRCRIAEVCNGT